MLHWRETGRIIGAAAIGALALFSLGAAAQAQATGAPEWPAVRIPDLSQVFVLFFVMLGPIKIIAPFAVMTKDASESACRKLAFQAFGVSSATALIAAGAGRAILNNWNVSLGALLIAGGFILFLVALRQVLQQYAPATDTESAHPAAPTGSAAIRLAFPTIVTPYGIATLIIVLSISPSFRYVAGVGAALIGVMALDLLAMLYARRILKAIGTMPLQIIGTVLSVMQVALGVQLMLGGLRTIGLLGPLPT
ncbi:MarC family protein [Dongia sp. agr-C8]